MNETIKVAAPNSLILVMDHSTGLVPDEMGDGLIASTASCIAVGTLSEFDGDTTVILTDALSASASMELVFSGMIETPSGTLSICNTRNEVLITASHLSAETIVQVFANDDSEPDHIVVFVQRPVVG